MQRANTFLQFVNKESYFQELLDIIITKLKAKAELLRTEQVKQLGEGFEAVTRPWALLLSKNNNGLKSALASKCFEIFKGSSNAKPEERIWLDLIQVCRIDTVHQLRALMCTLHVKDTPIASKKKRRPMFAANEISEYKNILNWIQNEKDGQPPSIIVVVDLLDYLVQDGNEKTPYDIRYLTVNDNELGHVLANLVESCTFESSFGTQDWENKLGVKMNHSTELLITDIDCLPVQQSEEEPCIKKLRHILNYYLDRLLLIG